MEINELMERINSDLIQLRKMVVEEKMIEIYEFYHGEQLIMVGTIKEISRYTGYQESTLKHYSYDAHLKKATAETSPRMIKITGGSL